MSGLSDDFNSSPDTMMQKMGLLKVNNVNQLVGKRDKPKKQVQVTVKRGDSFRSDKTVTEKNGEDSKEDRSEQEEEDDNRAVPLDYPDHYKRKNLMRSKSNERRDEQAVI